MTDDRMGARLRAAGLAFREAENREAENRDADNHGSTITAAPELDEPITITTVTHRPRRRPIAVLLSAAAVAAALVIGTVLALRGIGGDHQRGVAGAGPADQLVGRTWTFVDAEDATPDGGSSGGSVSPGITLTFDGDGGLTLVLRQTREQAQVRLEDDRFTVSGLHVVSTGSPQKSYDDQTQFANDSTMIEGFLDGSVDWTIQDGQLRLTRGIHSLVLDGPEVDRSSDPVTGESAATGSP